MKRFLIIFLFVISLFGQGRFYPDGNDLKPKDPNWGIDVDHIKIKNVDLIPSIATEIDSIAERVDTLRNVKKVYLVNGTDTTEIYDNGDTVYVNPSNNRPIKLGNVVIDTVLSNVYYIIDGGGGQVTIDGGLNSDTTITFNNTMNSLEIQSIIDNIPKYLNNKILKFLFQDGTYSLITSLKINGFYTGSIIITGNESEDETSLRTNQAVTLEFITTDNYGFDFSNNTSTVIIQNIRFESENSTLGTLNVENNLFTTIQGCSFLGNKGNADDVIADDSDTELLLHFENNVADDSEVGRTALSSQFTFSSVDPKFGNYNAVNADDNTGVVFPFANELLPSAVNTTWTLEMWVKMGDALGNQFLYSRSELYKGVLVNPSWQGSGNYFKPAIRYGTGSTYTTVVEASTIIPSDTWTHLAFVRNGNNYYIFKNGANIASDVSAAEPDLSDSPNIRIAFNLICSMDELRISSVARWTSNFTPPTAPYGDPTGIGSIIKTSKTDVYIRSNYFANSNIAIEAQNNRVFSWNNDDDPASVVLDYGLKADLGATIIKNGTQPAGNQSNEIAINGGEIR